VGRLVSSTKTFVIAVKPRDVLVDLKGLPDFATNAYMRFWMLHALHGEPLPPREEKKPREEWDAWFRDKLDMKNVRTWIKARDELLRLAKIRMTDDGRLYIARTMREAERRRGGDESKWGGDSDQGGFEFTGVHWAQTPEGRAEHGPSVDDPVEKTVDVPGKLATSAEDRPNFARTSPEDRPIWLSNPLILRGRADSSSYSYSKSDHEVVVVRLGAPRARGDPLRLSA